MFSPIEQTEELGVFGRLYSGNASAKILDFFIEHQEYTYTQSEVAEGTNISNKTVNSVVRNLEKLRLLKLDRKVGQAKLFRLNLEESKAAQLLAKAALELAIIENEQQKVLVA